MKFRIGKHFNDMTVAAACHKAQKRRFEIAVGKIVGGNMAGKMMYGYQRFAGRHRKPFCETYSDKQSAYETRRESHGYCVYAAERHSRFSDGFVRDTENIFTMAAGGYLGDDAAVFFVFLRL